MGRLPFNVELAKRELRKKSWETCLKYVESDAPLKERAELASKIVVKDMGEKVELSGEVSGTVIYKFADKASPST